MSAEPRFATARDFLYVIFKYRLMILSVFAVTSLTVLGVLSAMSDKYDAQASLLVQVGQENAGVPISVLNEAFIQGGVKREDVNSEIAAITSPALVRETVEEIGYAAFLAEGPGPETLKEWAKFLVKKVAKTVRAGYYEVLYALGLKKRLSDEEAVLALVQGSLVANPVKGSDVMAVALRLTNPYLAADFINALVENHLQRRIAYLGEAGASSLFERSLEESRKELGVAELALASFRAESKISSIDDQRRIALERNRVIEGKIDSVEAASARTAAEIRGLKSRRGKVPEGISSASTTNDPVGKELAESLATLYQNRARMLIRYRPDSRFVREIDDEIKAIEGQMAEDRTGNYGSKTVAANPNRQALERRVIQAEAELQGMEAELVALRADAEDSQQRIAQLDIDEARYRTLFRDRALAEQSLLSLDKKVEEALILRQMGKENLTNLIVLSPASPPVEPASPRRLLIMGAGLVGGLLAGIALAFLADSVDRSVRYSRDLERMGIPVLATVRKLDGTLRPALHELGRAP